MTYAKMVNIQEY